MPSVCVSFNRCTQKSCYCIKTVNMTLCFHCLVYVRQAVYLSKNKGGNVLKKRIQ